jgi:hypothetical protein
MPALGFYPHSPPKSDVPFDLLSGRGSSWIIPCAPWVFFVSNDNIIVAGCTFPGTSGTHIILMEIFTIYRFGWKIVIALDDDGLGTFG